MSSFATPQAASAVVEPVAHVYPVPSASPLLVPVVACVHAASEAVVQGVHGAPSADHFPAAQATQAKAAVPTEQVAMPSPSPSAQVTVRVDVPSAHAKHVESVDAVPAAHTPRPLPYAVQSASVGYAQDTQAGCQAGSAEAGILESDITEKVVPVHATQVESSVEEPAVHPFPAPQ